MTLFQLHAKARHMSRHASSPTIGALGELAFLETILPGLPEGAGIVIGPGQDCARVRAQGDWLLTIDSQEEGTHFRSEWLSPYQIGWKSFAVNASDIAAMGGVPRFALVNLAVPPAYPAAALRRLQSGIVAAADKLGGARVVGGNLTRAAQLAVTIALVGQAPKRRVTRQGARPGDRIWVTGDLGDAAYAVQQLSAGASLPTSMLRRFQTPTPRLQAGRILVERALASAMIDVSDGLLQDLGHICRASRVGAVVRTGSLPRSAAARRLRVDRSFALAGGEDYELLFTVAPHRLSPLRRWLARLGCPVVEIGEIVPGSAVRVTDPSGEPVRSAVTGFDHFK